MDRPLAWDRLQQVRFYQAWHYERDEPISETHAYLDSLPKDRVICADMYLIPWIVDHPNPRTWPVSADADHILLIERYADRWDSWVPNEALDTLSRSAHWRLRYTNGWLRDYERVGR